MIEKVGHIKNPLTVIAIFAAIAEISGTTVLPFIESNNQETYIWFLMIFPIFLVGTFFLTLNFNHKVLYAPSDYKDESNFLKLFDKASPEEQERKLREEIAESAEESSEEPREDPRTTSEQTESPPMNFVGNRSKNSQLMASVTLAEKLAVNSLSKELNLKFKTDVKMQINKRQVFFDALAFDGDNIHAVEVKLFRSDNGSSSRFDKILLETESIQNHFNHINPKKFTLHLYAVVDNPEVDKTRLRERLEKFNSRYNVNVKLKVVTLDELQNEWQYNP